MLTAPQRLSLLGGGTVGGDLGVDLLSELRVVGEGRLDLLTSQAEQPDRPIDPLGRWHVTAHQPADHLPDIRSTDQGGAASGWAIPERHLGVAPHSQTLIDQLLGKR
jgi:hypothetical protein